jgi:hypothetical protein
VATIVDRTRDIDLACRHLRFGWWSLFVFAALGLALETLHGFKAGMYLDLANETRRLMWTLAHAHGVLLAIVHVLFAVSLPSLPDLSADGRQLISRALTAASVLLPGGFFLGGVWFYGGDPGLAVLLVPPGAALLLLALVLVARASGRPAADVSPPRKKP